MLHLLIHPEQVARLKRELRQAGNREIGGIIVGEYVSDGVFDLIDFSIQQSGGSIDCFVREPSQHDEFLDRFFDRTGHDYTRFNYLGEWHSHPVFPVTPSKTDLTTMQQLVDDPEQRANFAMLLVLRLDHRGDIEATAIAFKAGANPVPVWIVERDTPKQSTIL